MIYFFLKPKPFVGLLISPTKLSCYLIQHRKRDSIIKAFQETALENEIVGNLILNYSKIQRTIKNFFDKNGLKNPTFALSLTAPFIEEKIESVPHDQNNSFNTYSLNQEGTYYFRLNEIVQFQLFLLTQKLHGNCKLITSQNRCLYETYSYLEKKRTESTIKIGSTLEHNPDLEALGLSLLLKEGR